MLEKINRLSLPITILLGCIILGGFYYAVQINKQRSIEEQERIERETESARQDLVAKQKECESLSSGVIDKWNNVMGVTYDDDLWEECVVTYADTKTGEVKVSPLRFMKTVD